MDIVQTSKVDLVWDFNNIPFPFQNNAFDEIFILNSIHCAKDMFRFMEEVYRIAKPDARIIIESVCFLSPINCQDPYTVNRIGFNTFDVFEGGGNNKGISYDTSARFKIIRREWIFSKNKYLRWISVLPNIFPKVYARFFYFWLPSNALLFKLKCVKRNPNPA